MSIYKPFTTSDVVVTPFKVNKSYSFSGSGSLDLPSNSIGRYYGKNITTTPWVSGSNPTGQIDPLNEELVYRSIRQLYYTNYLKNPNGSPVTVPFTTPEGILVNNSGAYQPMYDNYLCDTLPADRLFPTASNDRIGVISIPSNLFGEYIKPGTLQITYTGSIHSGVITDDENGNLISNGDKVGDIIYQHGILILTAYGTSITGSQYGVGLNLGYGFSFYGTSDAQELNDILSTNDINIEFQNTLTIYESQYKCTFNPNEFNLSQNPSIITGSCTTGSLEKPSPGVEVLTTIPDGEEGKMYNFATSSYFEPYITTVGLYNSFNELVAVGKLSQPLQSSNVTDTTILVNLDL